MIADASLAPVGRPLVIKIVLVCLGILLLAQILIGALSFSALERLMEDLEADRLKTVAGRLRNDVENGLHMGKPLAQFFGLEDLLKDVRLRSPEISGVSIILPDGTEIASDGSGVDQAELLRRTLFASETTRLDESIRSRDSDGLLLAGQNQLVFAALLKASDGLPQGALLMRLDDDRGALERLKAESFRILLLVTLAVAAALTLAFKRLLPKSALSGRSRRRFLIPLLALVLAQGGYTLHVVSMFRTAWLTAIQENVEGISADLAQNLDRILGYGFEINRLRDIEAPFSRLAKASPIISTIELVDAEGRVLNRAGAEGALRVDDVPARAGRRLTMPLGQKLKRPEAKGALVFNLNEEMLAAGVRSRGLDAMTVVVISLVAAIEMLLLSFLLINRPAAPRTLPKDRRPPPADPAYVGQFVRPIMFVFLFVWALPLGFLPLHARSLLNLQGSPSNLLLALPLALEMACGLLTTLAAGGMADSRGWRRPALEGLVVFSMGMLFCAMSDSLVLLTISRGVVGMGYGLTWMGLQGFVVKQSPEGSRGQNISEMIAGIFAGHLSGAAVGAMLAAQEGPRQVFALGAVMTLLPLLGVLILLKPYASKTTDSPPPSPPAPSPSPLPREASRLRATLDLLFSRGFGWLLFGSVIPFSVIQVGLLSFALPLYLESIDVPASSVGRVIMIYGLCLVYVGPWAARRIDGSPLSKKQWALRGSVLASISLFGLYAGKGALGAVLAVLALALASCCLGASQTPYMLTLPDVRRYGAASATSLLRAADKFGQMSGPLIVGALFGFLSMHESLAVTGLFCLAAVLPFALFAPSRPSDEASAASAAPEGRGRTSDESSQGT
ncbi:MAG: MFS transporter [Deltaproteobacteria bacterium]|nr:MFS transporter [Deltaproteobacteria bacterium]